MTVCTKVVTNKQIKDNELKTMLLIFKCKYFLFEIFNATTISLQNFSMYFSLFFYFSNKLMLGTHPLEWIIQMTKMAG